MALMCISIVPVVIIAIELVGEANSVKSLKVKCGKLKGYVTLVRRKNNLIALGRQ